MQKTQITMPADDELDARATRVWPNSEPLREKWKDAVRKLRTTTGGWVLDQGSRAPNWHANPMG